VLEKILDESFVRSFRVAMLVAAGLALASALCAGLMIGPQRRKPPAVNRDFGPGCIPGCIRATHFGKNDSPQFSSLRDLS
jgi:hypothetical protein